MSSTELIPLEEAQKIVLSHIDLMPEETVPLLDVVGRVCAKDQASDIDVSPFDHSAMDGFALRANEIKDASTDNPIQLKVIAEVAAGDVYEGPIADGECVRIMTGAPLPSSADSVVKYEIVENVEGDGKVGSTVAFTSPTKVASNIRFAGEEAKAGEVIIHAGEMIKPAGVGYLASCGIVDVPTYAKPRVIIGATGSELVPPYEMPGPGKIRESNSYVIAACAQNAGCKASINPIIKDTYEDLAQFVESATRDFDFVITTGGAANGDFDFIKQVVGELGEVYMTQVNMRPGKAQTFGIVNGCPVFGLPGNPAAAYLGFQMLIRPALRKMQGFKTYDHPKVKATLTKDMPKRDPRMIFARSVLTKDDNGQFYVTPADNQSSGLFGVIQKCNCMIIQPAGLNSYQKSDSVDCILLDVSEDLTL